jgi:hypothetical protein
VDCGGGGGCSFSLLQREMCFAAEEAKRRRRERERESGDSAGWVLEREKRRSGQRSGGSILPGDLEAEERCLSRSYRQRAACFSAASVCVSKQLLGY